MMMFSFGRLGVVAGVGTDDGGGGPPPEPVAIADFKNDTYTLNGAPSTLAGLFDPGGTGGGFAVTPGVGWVTEKLAGGAEPYVWATPHDDVLAAAGWPTGLVAVWDLVISDIAQSGGGQTRASAYMTAYAPNGLMKSSYTHIKDADPAAAVLELLSYDYDDMDNFFYVEDTQSAAPLNEPLSIVHLLASPRIATATNYGSEDAIGYDLVPPPSHVFLETWIFTNDEPDAACAGKITVEEIRFYQYDADRSPEDYL
jgi:hypothetical protein